MIETIAALFVAERSVYTDTPAVDAWPATRDARSYAGPHRVVAHPPCERWGRFWSGGPRGPVRYRVGEDGGCFESALGAVRLYGGVLEHPCDSRAWKAFGLVEPRHAGGWTHADVFGGITCCVEQGHYGHRGRKPTWLYAVGIVPIELRWGPSGVTWEDKIPVENMCHRERAATPIAFRDLLLTMARTHATTVTGIRERTSRRLPGVPGVVEP
jgi:hypothetical protein